MLSKQLSSSPYAAGLTQKQACPYFRPRPSALRLCRQAKLHTLTCTASAAAQPLLLSHPSPVHRVAATVLSFWQHSLRQLASFLQIKPDQPEQQRASSKVSCIFRLRDRQSGTEALCLLAIRVPNSLKHCCLIAGHQCSNQSFNQEHALSCSCCSLCCSFRQHKHVHFDHQGCWEFHQGRPVHDNECIACISCMYAEECLKFSQV